MLLAWTDYTVGWYAPCLDCLYFRLVCSFPGLTVLWVGMLLVWTVYHVSGCAPCLV